jgi:hypothetical protein
MLSELRIQANRENAQKSTGPKTDAGKAAASQNAVRHGLCSTTFVCANESLDEYYELRDDYMARYAPRDQVEIDLVDRMVHATWNIRRTWTMENETLDLQRFRMEGSLDAQYSDVPERTRTAAAIEALAKQPALSLLQRYETRQANLYHRALKTLKEVQKDFPLAPNGPLRKPDPRPADQTNPTPSPAVPQVNSTTVAQSTQRATVRPISAGWSRGDSTHRRGQGCEVLECRRLAHLASNSLCP